MTRMADSDPHGTLSSLTQRVLRHRDERDWGQFHTPKELAISLAVEATELLSLMQWKTGEQLAQAVADKREKIVDELADVLHSTLLLAADLQIDLAEALEQKLQKDARKYPVEKAKGKNLKYDEL
jgi:NTP pyrophosphatase (non-canonical NTP hydrolase)